MVSNIYLRDFYVNYNRSVYNFIKYNLQNQTTNNEIRNIHIIGTISPINADIYSKFLTEAALKAIGKNPGNYYITTSKYQQFLSRIQKSDFIEIKENITFEEFKFLSNFYIYEPKYEQYNLAKWPSETEKTKLEEIFIASCALPQKLDPATLIIDISWTDIEYYTQ
jgi:hypothetical protein